MDKKLKAAIREKYADLCRWRRPTYNGEHYICELKERKEKCINRDKFDMLLNCPRDCPYFPRQEKVLCDAQSCRLSAGFVKDIEVKLNN